MIPKNYLTLRTGNASFSFGYSHAVSIGWQVYADQVDTIVESGILSRSVPTLAALENAADELIIRANGEYDAVVQRHKANAKIGGYSVFDADLILDSWWFQDNMEHPICGTHEWSGGNSIVGRINRILEICLPPPTWFWAESINPGELRVRCVAVPGADSYNVYNGDILIANVPAANWQTISVDPGSYSVRAAAVGGSQVGILSFQVPVTVYGAEGMMATASVMETEPVRDTSIMRRFWKWVFYGG